MSAFDVVPALVNPPFVALSSEFQLDMPTGRVCVRMWSRQVLASSTCPTSPWEEPAEPYREAHATASLSVYLIAPNDDSVYWHVTCLRKVFCVSLDVLV